MKAARKDDKRWCDFCNRPWYNRDTCWKLNGKLGQKNGKQVDKNRSAQSSTYGQHQSHSGLQSLIYGMEEQVEFLHRFMNQYKESPNLQSSYSSAQQGSCMPVFSNTHAPQIIDFGAINHMTSASNLFVTYNTCSDNQNIKIANGTLSSIVGKGSILIFKNISFYSVLHVPSLSCNLFSAFKFTNDNNCVAKFYPVQCEFQELNSRKMIDNAKKKDGLYFFDDALVLKGQEQVANNRLRHLSFYNLKRWFSSLFKNKGPPHFECKFVKFQSVIQQYFLLSLLKNPYLQFLYIAIFRVRLVFLMLLVCYVSFIDDHTRVFLMYLLKEKSKVKTVF